MVDATNLQYTENEITVLEGLEPVRLRPGMYIGGTDIKAFHHLFNEVIDNAIDEAMAGRCDEITVALLEPDVLRISDNGAGIPVGPHPVKGISTLEVVMTMLNAGGKFGTGGYKVSGGLHGVGVSCVNALSEYFVSDVYRDGYHWRMRFERGAPVTELQQLEADERNGTTQTFKPDYEIFGKGMHFHPEMITGRLRELAYLNRNVKIHFINELTGEKETFHFTGGIAMFVEKLNHLKDPLHKPLYVVQRAR